MSDDKDLGKERLRLWLRLLTTSTLIEHEIRNRLRSEFKVTLPQFDLMAVLFREPDGVTMSELSRRLLVSNGNVTGLADRLERSGMIRRWSPPEDRRTSIVTLTEEGQDAFAAMASVREGWIDELLASVDEAEINTLMTLLSKIKGKTEDRVSGGKDE